MSPETLPPVDITLLKAWTAGWAAARDTAPPVADRGGFRIDVGWPEQRVRYVFASLSDELRDLGETIIEPWFFLKACTTPEAMRAALPVRWTIQPVGFLMTCAEAMMEAAPPAGYRLDVTPSKVPVVKIITEDGAVAAVGRVACAHGFAIYDRIETHPDHRRRGLGRALMKALEGLARAQGITQGVLVATADGRALYEALGWRLRSLYTTAVIAGG